MDGQDDIVKKLSEQLARDLSAKRAAEPKMDTSAEGLTKQFAQERRERFPEKFPASSTITVSPEQKRDLTFGQASKEAVKNLPGSTVKAAVDVVQPLLPWNWRETGQSIYGLGKGLASKAGLVSGQSAEQKAKDEAIADALGEFYKNRYGSWQGFKQAMAEDPASILLDLSTPLTMGSGAAAMLPGKAAAATAKGLGAAAKYTSPFTAPIAVGSKIPGVKPALEKTGDLLASAVTFPTETRGGIMPGGLKESFKAGLKQTPEYDPLIAHMRGQVPATDIINKIDDISSNIAETRKLDYLSGMRGPVAKKIVDLTPIRALIQKNVADTANLPSGQTMMEIQKLIDDFETKGIIKGYQGSPGYKVADPMNPTVFDVDKLKQTIGEIAANKQLPGSAAAGEVRKNLAQLIRDTDQGYGAIMDRYADLSDQLKEIKYLAGSNRQLAEQRLGKLMRASKDKYKKSLFDELFAQNPELAMAIRGQSMSEYKLPSLQEFAIVGGLPGFAYHPAAGVGAAALDVITKSPRLTGEAAYKLGQGARLAEKAQLGRAAVPLAQIEQFQQRLEREEQKKKKLEEMPIYGQAGGGRVARADGGRIDIQRGVRALMRAADNAKKSISKTTESLLEQPDEHIAQALDIAKKHI